MIKNYISKILLGTVISSCLVASNACAANAAAETALSEDQISSFGCIAGGVSIVAAAYWAGPSEAIMIWGGGLLTPSGSNVLALSIIGGMGAVGCSIGATIAPTIVWAYQQL